MKREKPKAVTGKQHTEEIELTKGTKGTTKYCFSHSYCTICSLTIKD